MYPFVCSVCSCVLACGFVCAWAYHLCECIRAFKRVFVRVFCSCVCVRLRVRVSLLVPLGVLVRFYVFVCAV